MRGKVMKSTYFTFTAVLVLFFASDLQSPALATQYHPLAGERLIQREAKPEKLTTNQLQSLTAAATKPEQHLRLARYYKAKADRYLTESVQFSKMAEQFRGNPITNNNKAVFGTVNHCEYFAQSFKQRASKMQQAAQMQEQMAKVADRK
jgi:hypothetical protein